MIRLDEDEEGRGILLVTAEDLSILASRNPGDLSMARAMRHYIEACRPRIRKIILLAHPMKHWMSSRPPMAFMQHYNWEPREGMFGSEYMEVDLT